MNKSITPLAAATRRASLLAVPGAAAAAFRALLLRCVLAIAGLGLASTAVAGEFEQGLLWEVSNGSAPKSYLFGTMHYADPRLLELAPEVDEAFDGARTFILEMYPDEAVSRRFSQAGLLEGGKRLSGLLPPDVFERLARLLEPRGIAKEQLDAIKPWAALLLATATEGKGGESLDISLYVRARYANMRIEELDSVEEQIAVFDGIPEATQVALVDIALRRRKQMQAEMEDSIAAYRRGDLAELARLARRNGGDSADGRAHQAVFEKKIIHDRSVVMAYRLQSYLRRGRVFAAVGALHLYGPKGMLALLREDGWQLRRIR